MFDSYKMRLEQSAIDDIGNIIPNNIKSKFHVYNLNALLQEHYRG